MKIATSQKEAEAMNPEHIFKDSDTSYRCYFAGEIQRPVIPENPVPQEVDALQGLKAIDAAGLSAAYETWANDPKRKFLEKAFINRAQTWRRDDPVLSAGAAALGLSAEQLDQLFVLAATL
jgi:hypothetical protein